MERTGDLAVFDLSWRCTQIQATDSATSAGATAVFRRDGGDWLLALLALDADPAHLDRPEPNLKEEMT